VGVLFPSYCFKWPRPTAVARIRSWLFTQSTTKPPQVAASPHVLGGFAFFSRAASRCDGCPSHRCLAVALRRGRAHARSLRSANLDPRISCPRRSTMHSHRRITPFGGLVRISHCPRWSALARLPIGCCEPPGKAEGPNGISMKQCVEAALFSFHQAMEWEYLDRPAGIAVPGRKRKTKEVFSSYRCPRSSKDCLRHEVCEGGGVDVATDVNRSESSLRTG
jgi:hypothetical protein